MCVWPSELVTAGGRGGPAQHCSCLSSCPGHFTLLFLPVILHQPPYLFSTSLPLCFSLSPSFSLSITLSLSLSFCPHMYFLVLSFSFLSVFETPPPLPLSQSPRVVPINSSRSSWSFSVCVCVCLSRDLISPSGHSLPRHVPAFPESAISPSMQFVFLKAVSIFCCCDSARD